MEKNEIKNLLYCIEEEDLIISENGTNKNDYFSIHETEYIDLKAEIIFFNNESILNKEIEDRIKSSNIFFPAIIGICNHSSLGFGLVMEKARGESIFKLIYHNDLNFERKIDIIYNLINFFDFCNSRNVYFYSLSLSNFTYDNHNDKIYFNKFPLMETEISFENFNYDEWINIAPDILPKITNKSSNINTYCSDNNEWNLGLLIYEILENKHFIFPGFQSKVSTSSILEKISSLDVNVITTKLNSLNYNQHLKNILKKLLKLNPRQRMTSKLLKKTFNKKLILDSHFATNTEKPKDQYRESTISHYNNSNFSINESIYPNEISQMELSVKEINLNPNNTVTKLKSLEVLIEPEDQTDISEKKSEKITEISIISPNEKSELMERIFENVNKKNSQLNLLNDSNIYNEDKNQIEDKVILPICGEINNEGENFIQFEDEKYKKSNSKYNNTINETLLLNVNSNESLISNESGNKNNVPDVSLQCNLALNKSEMRYIDRLEEIAYDYKLTGSDHYLTKIEDIIMISPQCNKIKDTICNNEEKISECLWESLLCIAFKLLERDEIKNHFNISTILYSTVDKVYTIEDSYKIALAKFHYGKSMKDYSSNFSLALNLFLESIQLLKKVNEENSNFGVQVKFFLGSLYDDMGMSDESIEILRDVLQSQIKLFTEENIFTARTYNCLGIAEDNRGNYKKALENYQKAYTIFKNLSFGHETIDCAKVLNNLAGIYYKWEDYVSCVKFYLKVLEVYHNIYGEESSYVAITLYNLGNCFYILKKDQKAIEHLKQALTIFLNELGPSHPQTATCFKTLGDIYFSMSDIKQALDMYSQCVNTFLEKYGDDNDLYISTISKIKKLNKQ